MPEPRGALDLTPEQLKHFLETKPEGDYELIDVRQPMEYRQGHLPGARHIPLGRLEEALPGLDPRREYVFYCHSGHRSQVAARMALASKRFKEPIRQLQGGILAWNGHALPDVPHVDAFKDANSLADRLRRALELEKGAWLLYQDVQKRSQRPILCELMGRLLEMEIKHAQIVHEQLKAQGETLPPFDELFDALPGDILESGQRIEDLEFWLQAALSGDCLDIAELALEVEYGAYDLYRAMASQAGSEHEQSVFLNLAEQEKWHAKTILDALDQLLESDEGA